MIKPCTVTNHAVGFVLMLYLTSPAAIAADTISLTTDAPVPSARVDSIAIFTDQAVEFEPDREAPRDAVEISIADNGRLVGRDLHWPAKVSPSRVFLHTRISPIPKDETSVHDPWDRAGHVGLSIPGHPEVELLKFITAYGGQTEYRVDVSHLAPLFDSESQIGVFIDTWLSPAWRVDVWFELEPRSPDDSLSSWVMPLFLEPQFDAEVESRGGVGAHVNVPKGLGRVLLYLYTSGHCTDGRGADEFESKDHVLRVDGDVVHRFRPWRDDCRSFRAINPYCRRWSDGSWSCDYARSGWCPGDLVAPLMLDLTDHLTQGQHDVQLQIEDVRPADQDDHKGYWRVSAYVVGYP